MTNQELEKIKDRLAKITSGPWATNYHCYSYSNLLGEGQTTNRAWDVVTRTSLIRVPPECPLNSPGDLQAQADASFIAHAPEDMAALIAEVERLRIQLASARADVRELSKPFDLGRTF